MSGNPALRRSGNTIVMAALAAMALLFALCLCGTQLAFGKEAPSEEALDDTTSSVANDTDAISSEDQGMPESEEGSSANEDLTNPYASMKAAFVDDVKAITVGQTLLVGFAPEASDAESEDENRVKWHEDWKAAVKSRNVSLDSLNGWLAVEDEEGARIDYDAILGITTSDPSVFELFGEYPEWKIDDEGTEYRWWYGLLGRAKSAGQATVSIVYRLADGSNYTSDECIVTVGDSKQAGADLATQSNESEESGSGASDSLDTQAEDGTDSNLSSETSSENGGDGSASSDDAAGTSNDDSSTASESSADDAAAQEGSNSSSTTVETQESQDNQGTASYPKRVAVSTAGAAISAELLVNDESSDQLFAQAANGATLSLSVEAVEKFGDTAEQAVTTTAGASNLDVAERLSIKVIDESGNEIPLSGMQLTLNIAADDAIKDLTPSTLQAWYVAENGATEQKNAKLSGGVLTIETEHTSDYVILGMRATSSNTNSNASSSGPAASGATNSSGAANSTGSNTTSNSSGSSSSTGKSGLPQTGDLMAYLAVALAFVAGFSASSALNARRRIKDDAPTSGEHSR